MRKISWILALAALALMTVGAAPNSKDIPGHEISGMVVDEAGKPIRGAMVSAFSDSGMQSVSVYSLQDGSFKISGLPAEQYELRSRLIGYSDVTLDAGHVHMNKGDVKLTMAKASAEELQLQRTPNNLRNMLKFDDEKDELNFNMMCTYCHQVGTLGFRSPEEPVDWEVMLTRMDGFQGLYKHTQEVLVDKVVSVYGREAEAEWPAYEPPPAPEGDSLKGKVWEWAMGTQNNTVIHDLELGNDGIVYTVDMVHDAIVTLDPNSGERAVYSIPGGKEYGAEEPPIKGPHSLEMDADGHMWVTLALSGEMGFFDTDKKQWRVVSGHEAPRPRAGYPHTLRIARDGVVWWTDAALGVFSLDPKTYDAANNRYDVKFYKLPSKDQVQGGGARGESRGITPYGIDIAPNGHIWYGKLNGQRIGRIIRRSSPTTTPRRSWNGSRRFTVRVACTWRPTALVWVPGWASGDIASSYDPSRPKSGATSTSCPRAPNSLPYALNIEPETGHRLDLRHGHRLACWRFDPESEAVHRVQPADAGHVHA